MTDQVGSADEVPDVVGHGATASPQRERAHRWPWAAGALVVSGILVWPTVHQHIANGELHRLDALWAYRGAYAKAGDDLAQQLYHQSVPTDRTFGSDLAAIDDTEADALQHLRERISDVNAVTGQVRSVRSAMLAALDADIRDVRRDAVAARSLHPLANVTVVPLLSLSTWWRIGLAQHAVNAAQLTHHLSVVSSPAVTLRPRVDWGRYHHLLGHPSGLALWVVNQSGVARIDLDTGAVSRVTTSAYGASSVLVIGNAAEPTVVYAGTSGITLMPPGGPARRLPGTEVISGATRDEFWSIDPEPKGDQRLIDATGRQRAAFTAPNMAWPRIGSAAGIIAPDIIDGRAELWRSTSPSRPERVLHSCGWPVAAHGDLLAWSDCANVLPAGGGGRLHLRNLVTGTDRLISTARPMVLSQQSPAMFSPDGLWLAGFWLTPNGGEFAVYDLPQNRLLTPVNVTSGLGTFGSNLAWTPDSTRVIFTVADGNAPLALYDVRTETVTDLRWFGETPTAIALSER